MFIFLNASSLTSHGSSSVINTSISSTSHILKRCSEPIFSDIHGDTTFRELWIIAFFICTISQSNSVSPSTGCKELVPKKQMSTLISESILMALPPMAIWESLDIRPPIKITSILLFVNNCTAMGKLGVKQVNLNFEGKRLANSKFVVPPLNKITWPSLIKERHFSAIWDFSSSEYTVFPIGL